MSCGRRRARPHTALESVQCIPGVVALRIDMQAQRSAIGFSAVVTKTPDVMTAIAIHAFIRKR